MNVNDLALNYCGSTAILDEVLGDLAASEKMYPEAIQELFRQEPSRLFQVSIRIDGRTLHVTYHPSEYLNGFAEALKAIRQEGAT